MSNICIFVQSDAQSSAAAHKAAALSAVDEMDRDADMMMDGITTERISTKQQVDRYKSSYLTLDNKHKEYMCTAFISEIVCADIPHILT